MEETEREGDDVFVYDRGDCKHQQHGAGGAHAESNDIQVEVSVQPVVHDDLLCAPTRKMMKREPLGTSRSIHLRSTFGSIRKTTSHSTSPVNKTALYKTGDQSHGTRSQPNSTQFDQRFDSTYSVELAISEPSEFSESV